MTSLADALSMPVPTAPSSTSSSRSARQFSESSAVSSEPSPVGTHTNASPAAISSATSRNPPLLEFTKRKRWADLLLTELSEAVVIVLSPAGKIWYCGAAVAELLGWKDEDMVDREFCEYVNHDDIGPFRASFQRCIHLRNELITYIRLRCKPASVGRTSIPQDFQASANAPVKEVLFEIEGFPHFVPSASNGGAGDCTCFFMMAKPYPSRNMAIQNTFLELKMENQHMEERLQRLRALDSGSQSTTPTTTSSSSLAYPSPFHPSPYAVIGQSQYSNSLPALPEPTTFYSGSYEELLPSPSSVKFEQFPSNPAQHQNTANGAVSASGGASAGIAGEDDEVNARKKLKKSFGFEQYVCVTCGRTDSPEWRKGPNGPKTLCNACGLRWAKTVKMRKDAAAAASSATGVTLDA